VLLTAKKENKQEGTPRYDVTSPLSVSRLRGEKEKEKESKKDIYLI
jgi:hypothetical protein